MLSNRIGLAAVFHGLNGMPDQGKQNRIPCGAASDAVGNLAEHANASGGRSDGMGESSNRPKHRR